MKKFFSVLSLIIMMVFAAPEVEAKKFGGGKSFGKSYKTAPAPTRSSTATNTNSTQDKNRTATNTGTQSGAKKGFMGGMLGGLLAGGLLAALFAGGAFEGFQFLDFIIVAAIAFFIFKFFKTFLASKRGAINQPKQAYAGANSNNKGYFHQQQPEFKQTNTGEQGFASGANQNSGGFNQDVPFNFPPNFDQVAFLQGAREHYRILQQAWNDNDLAKIQEYVTTEMYNDLSRERATLAGRQHTQVMFVDAQIVRADHNGQRAELSIKFSGRYKDDHEGIEEDIKDIWHLERSLTQPNSDWLIVGIE